jgi:hypothetical protein
MEGHFAESQHLARAISAPFKGLMITSTPKAPALPLRDIACFITRLSNALFQSSAIDWIMIRAVD